MKCTVSQLLSRDRDERDSDQHRVLLAWVDLVAFDGLGHDLTLDLAVIGQRLERSHSHEVTVHLEEMTQRFTGIGLTKTIRTQRHETTSLRDMVRAR